MEIRIFSGPQVDEIQLGGAVDPSNVHSVCDRVAQRLSGRRGREIALDLSEKDLDAVSLGQLVRTISDCEQTIVSLALSRNRLTDFDLAFAFDPILKVTDIDLTENDIGDFGLVTLLQIFLKSQAPRPVRVRLGGNLIGHPKQVLEAVPPNLRPLIGAPGVPGFEPSEDMQVFLVGLDSQRCKRTPMKPEGLRVPIIRPSGIKEPAADDMW